ncbi:helix-turn-helix domain-containing protein [uncultured Desulfovibrio sp.]|uniref:helix-turn-helix domain-containing protein n=1 Tax=uncultured Desulfovibrio sp. TaxID=167968 RepID=UPI00345C09E1
MKDASRLGVLERLRKVSGASTDKELAGILGVSRQAISQAKIKGVPSAWIPKAAKLFNVASDWILFGDPSDKDASSYPPADRSEIDTTRLQTAILRIEAWEDERRELSAENRQLWKENASLRERVARLEEQVKALRIAPAAPPMGASPPTAPVSAQHAPLPGPANR